MFRRCSYLYLLHHHPPRYPTALSFNHLSSSFFYSGAAACAMASSSSLSKTAVTTSKSPAALGAYSQAIRCSFPSSPPSPSSPSPSPSLLFISGQLGLVAETSTFSTVASCLADTNKQVLPCCGSALTAGPDISSDVQAQTHTAMCNMCHILTATGATFDNVVKTTILLTDMSHFQEVNSVYASFFASSSPPPARACFAVRELPRQALVEIEAVAAIQ
eukprot:GHVS01028681.1.p1 GENE.GHVS01028681.1~~GHVS01028681.1.p1  ORF type:complete len:218 (-),score=73.62 GHVS01028681.1:166-819(-)